jgi:hypothetical protein
LLGNWDIDSSWCEILVGISNSLILENNGNQLAFTPRGFASLASPEPPLSGIVVSVFDAFVAAEFLKLFPASFEMTMQFFQECVDDLEAHSRSISSIGDVLTCMQSIRPAPRTSFVEELNYWPPMFLDDAEKDLAKAIERYFYYHTQSKTFDGCLRNVVESCIIDVNDKVSSVLERRDEYLDDVGRGSAVLYCCAVLNMHISSLEMQGVIESIMDVNEV